MGRETQGLFSDEEFKELTDYLQGVGIQLHQITRDVSIGVVVWHSYSRHRVCCRAVDRLEGHVSARVHNHLSDDATRYVQTRRPACPLDEDWKTQLDGTNVGRH